MKMQIFSIYDQKAEAFLQPFFQPNINMAKRTFSDVVNDPEHSFSRHPDDYSLFHVGEFDDEDAVIATCKKGLGNGVEYLRPENIEKL